MDMWSPNKEEEDEWEPERERDPFDESLSVTGDIIHSMKEFLF
jgi:hypothetical protein